MFTTVLPFVLILKIHPLVGAKKRKREILFKDNEGIELTGKIGCWISWGLFREGAFPECNVDA